MIKNTPFIRIEFSNRFNQQLESLPREIKMAFIEALQFFKEDPSHSLLRNHPLKEKLAGYRSIDVTEDYRAIFKESKTRKQKIITFHKIGTHRELYGS